MKELLEKINESIDKLSANSSAETQLKLKILKNNISTIFSEHENKEEKVIDKTPEKITENNFDSLEQDDMKSILIVDDSTIIRNYLEKILIKDYNIKMAVDGNECIERLKHDKKINIILLDLIMPKADGFVVLDFMAQNNIDIPTIIISGETSKDSVTKAFEYNISDVIKKPFDIDIIKEKIERYSK